MIEIPMPKFVTDTPTEAQLAEWEKSFWNEGYIVIKNALPKDTVAHFLERMSTIPDSAGYEGSNSLVRLFEQGMDFVNLLENEPIISIMRRVLGDDCHIIALQGHRMSKGNEVSSWHADEIFLQRPHGVADSVPYPPIINAINCHYYVMDVPVELGPTEVVPYSHRACRQPTPSDGDPPKWDNHEPKTFDVSAGDCIMYSNQTWHRGAPNSTDQTRLSVVPSYSRRFVAQRFWPFLNYNLSRDVLDRCSPSQRVLLGEHHRGAYG